MRRVLVAFLIFGLASCSGLSDLHGIQGRGGDADSALDAGLDRLLDQPDLGFRYLSETSGPGYSVTMTGSLDLESLAWAAEGRFTAFRAPRAHLFEVRSIGPERWVDFIGADGGAAPCWTVLAEDEGYPGLPAIDPGIPGFVTALDGLHEAAWQFGLDGSLTAQLSLRDAAKLATSATLAPWELAAASEVEGEVAVTVSLKDGVVHEVVLAGRELGLALRAGDVRMSEEDLLELESRDVRLTFGGPTRPVKLPDPSRVFDWVHPLKGCPDPEATSA